MKLLKYTCAALSINGNDNVFSTFTAMYILPL